MKANDKDCWFLTTSGCVVKLTSIENDKLAGLQIHSVSDFYTHPLKSSLLNIFEAEQNFENLQYYSTDEIKAKMFCIKKNSSKYVFFPLLHSFKE